MSKLSPQTIREIIRLFSEGTPVSLLSKQFGITNMVVYYHTKKYKTFKKRKPCCYNDYLINKICDKQIEYQTAPEEKKIFIRDEILRLKDALGIKRDKCSGDPFVFQ